MRKVDAVGWWRGKEKVVGQYDQVGWCVGWVVAMHDSGS